MDKHGFSGVSLSVKSFDNQVRRRRVMLPLQFRIPIMTALYEHHPPMFKNNPFGFVVCLLLIPAVGIGLLILLWWYLKCKSVKVTVTDADLRLEEGLLSKSRTELKLTSVRTVKINQSFFQRIFGTGDIEVYTSGDAPEFTVRGMPKPEELKVLIAK